VHRAVKMTERNFNGIQVITGDVRVLVRANFFSLWQVNVVCNDLEAISDQISAINDLASK